MAQYKWVLGAVFLTGIVGFASGQPTQGQTTPATREFMQTDVMIPMRDGSKLQTVIFAPAGATAALPVLLNRTPYGIPADSKGLTVKGSPYEPLETDGYIFVFQNIRGRFKSEGTFVMQRSLTTESGAKAFDESTDAYDTIDWLVKHVPKNNGKVGIWGISYSGWTSVMALHDPHPALKAASEQASPADMFLGDDFHHNGAFRLSYGLEYSALVEAEKESNFNFKFNNADTYEWYLKLGPLANVNKQYFHGTIPAWNDFEEHPSRDTYWKAQATDGWLHGTTVPVQNVAGWWDQEDFFGPVKTYELLEEGGADKLNYLVVGPWNHGGWFRTSGTHLGDVAFGSATGEYFRAQVMAPWFRYWLHGEGSAPAQKVLAFETGANVWRQYAEWPPKRARATPIYLGGQRTLTFAKPAVGSTPYDAYVSDPANPVPYRPRPISPTYPGPDWPKWLVQDQRFVDHRPDVLSFETEPLTADVRIAGDVLADIYATTTGTDADWIVKLIDVLPEDAISEVPAEGGEAARKVDMGGYELMISDEVFRGRFLHGFEKPESLPAGKVLEYKFDLHTADHVFLKGHKIMVQIQSTWFPIIDRNPQTFVPSIFAATAGDYQKATETVYHSATYPSQVILPVIQ